MSQAKAETALNSLLEIIQHELAGGRQVQFKGFGTFSVKSYGPRSGRNLRTGEAIVVPAREAVHFKASSVLKAQVQDHG